MTAGFNEFTRALRAGVPAAWFAAAAALAFLLTLALAVDHALAAWRTFQIEPPPAQAQSTTTDTGPLRAQTLRTQVALIDGRSLFVIPPKPEPRPAEPDEPVRAAPLVYAGPAPIAMINNAVWFSDGRRLPVGDQPQGDDDLAVVATSPPWSATVRWQGGEFSVDLFSRNSLVTPARTSPPASSASPSRSDRTEQP